VRFRTGGAAAAYGIVEGEQVWRLQGELFGTHEKTSDVFALADVELLVPTAPTQVLAMAGNYKSHHNEQKIDPKFQVPQLFFKSASCLLAHGGTIELPAGSAEVHFEGELVLVIGKRARNVPVEKAQQYIFGVTCGNDVSARDWQKNDVQWWRAKGSETFGPCGPYIVKGLDPDNLLVELRQNGQTKQQQSTRDLIHSCAEIVSFVSRHLTLEPGDLIYTGTPGKTSALHDGDTVEVEIQHVGLLRNKVRATKRKSS
jgi:2-keto-4-pentenoate hydratase/2-oxohepta-3-ene-1,7-dioic acid hydratase in catechol pathway